MLGKIELYVYEQHDTQIYIHSNDIHTVVELIVHLVGMYIYIAKNDTRTFQCQDTQNSCD